MVASLKSCSETTVYGPLGNVFFRAMNLSKKGDLVEGHAHRFDHVSFLYKGSIHCSTDGWVADYSAPARILIRKGIRHTFVALEDDTLIDCIFALREIASGELVDEWDGSLEPYR